VVQPWVGVASGYIALLTRVNDASFGFSPYLDSEAGAVSRFVTTAAALTAMALGRDLKGDGTLMGDEIGPAFGTCRDPVRGQEYFAVLGANQPLPYKAPLNAGDRCCNDPDDWYRLQLYIDLGTGAGDLYYMNLTRGDTQFQPIEELQGMNLHMDAMHPDAGPQNGDAMMLVMRFDGNQHLPKADNLVSRVPVVLDPDWGIQLEALEILDIPYAKFHVYLERVTNADDPDGYYWQFKESQPAETSLPASAEMAGSWDLLLNSLDVSLLDPSMGSLEQVRLQFMGWDGMNPETATWRYVAE
jgi:hypothetical protein